jgi:hypothetical protein
LFQTVWNVQHGFEPTHGIRDYDLFYFDDRDTSWEAEDVCVRQCAGLFADLRVHVEVRNQARVHRWYPAKFGASCKEFRSTEEGIDSFLATSCCVGMRKTHGALTVYAPHGLADLFDLIVRPNAARVDDGGELHEVYATKAHRWSQTWPRLEVLPWPTSGGGRRHE